jgi:hypothetical protein
MAKTAITFGIILTLLGLIAYFGISSESITALIPAFFGVPVIILGWLALNEKWVCLHKWRKSLIDFISDRYCESRGLTNDAIWPQWCDSAAL